MGAAKGRDPLTRAGQQVAKGRAGISAETLVISSVTQDAGAKMSAANGHPNIIVSTRKDADGNDIVLTAHNPEESTEWIIDGLLRRGGWLEVDIYDL